jgi:hypothetical protein
MAIANDAATAALDIAEETVSYTTIAGQPSSIS